MLNPLRFPITQQGLFALVFATVPALSAQVTVTQIQRHGITWRFAQPVTAGQFINGDWWVQAPATVASVSPAATSGRHGSMVNPRAGNAGRTHGQGYDNRIAYFDPARTISYPLTLRAGDSLISTESRTGGRLPSVFRGATSQAYLVTAAVLTCVAQPASPYTFRPAYCGPKTFRDASQIRYDLLPSLPRVQTSLDPRRYARQFERVWLDHVNGWEGRYLHPSENMADYGREIALAAGEGGLLLLQDYPVAERTELLVNYLQVGIDLWGLVQDGHVWWADGGHMQGRKWPIIFAGLMFDDTAMANPGLGFSEDKQTYAADGWTAARSLFRMRGSDTHEERHPSTWDSTDRSYEEYRRCCTSYSWVGSALCAHIMGATENWGWEPFFHYVDRWMTPMYPPDQTLTESVIGNVATWFPHRYLQSDVVRNMWDTYRNDYQPPGISVVGQSSHPELRLGVFDSLRPGQQLEMQVWNTPRQNGVIAAGPMLPTPVQLLGGDVYIDPIDAVPLPTPNHDRTRVFLRGPSGGPQGLDVGLQLFWLDTGNARIEHSWAYRIRL